MERSSRTKKATFYTFLQDHKAEKGSAFTHTSIYHPIGSFYIPPEDVDRFFELYKEAFVAGEELYLTEKHREIGPVIIDLDFRFEHAVAAVPAEAQESGDALRRRYQKGDIDKVIEIYGNALTTLLAADEVRSFDVYVMEKPVPSLTMDKSVEKDGVHLVIPDVVTNVMTQLKLREMVLEPLSLVLGPMGITNSITDVVDEAVISRNNWQMLGSKKPHCEMYRVTRIVRYDCATKSMTDIDQDKITEDRECQAQFVERLSIRNKFVETQLKTEAVEEIAAYELKMQESKIKSHFKNTILTKTRNCKNNTNEDDMRQAAILVDFLNTARAESYYDWIRVGWCLRNIDHRLLEKWTQFSRKSPKFAEGECERMWNYMRQDGACLGMGTLHLWAKSDSPEEYAKYMATELRTLIRESANGSEYDIARVVHRKYDHLYAYDACSKTWYYFANHRWHHSSEGLALKRMFPTEVAVEYRRAASYYITMANQIEDTAQKNVLDELATKLQGIVTKLKKAAFQACVMTECVMLFAIDKFEEKLDSNRNLVGFENGVYDLDALEFRDGRPEDFVSLSTGVNYIPYDPMNTTCIKEILAFTRQVITIDRVREYVLGLLASFLHGDIREERFHVWTGSGCHKVDTPIMMYDGTIKMVQDVCIGDKLMGDDSKPREVLQLFRGRDTMYEIIPVKGDPFIVNKGHSLSLKATNFTTVSYRQDGSWTAHWMEYHPCKVLVRKSKRFDNEDEAREYAANIVPKKDNVCQPGDVLDISVEKYLQHYERFGKRHLSLYRVPVDAYPEKAVSIDPYLLGYWLGDGHSNAALITTADQEVVNYMYECWDDVAEINPVQSKGKATTYSIKKKEGKETCLYSELRQLNLINNKHIPKEYMFNSRAVRLEVLAGMIDSDGYYQPHTNQFEVTFKSERLMDDLIHLARSLGFAAFKHLKTTTWTYNGEKKYGTAFRTQIVGDITTIPTKIARKMPRKRIKTKDVTLTGFDLRELDEDDYYGFEVDGNHHFLMGDFVVQRNSNGKSKLLELYQKAFGDYCCTLPIALLTQKRGSSSGASPELARARRKRFACLQEPGENERLNIGLMKEMTGGDTLYARGLYKDGMEFKPQFKMILTCNHLPLVPSDDGGTWRRIRVVRFESKFCENPDPSKPNEFPIDTSLSQKFNDWSEGFMSLLVEYYKKNVTEKIVEPDEVLECTREYQRRNDIIADFLDSAVVRDETGFLQLGEAFNDFKSWLKDEGCTDRSMRKSDFQSYIEKVYGKATMLHKLKGWRGYKLKSSLVEAAMDDYD